jgi:hypothetical protein
MEWPIIIPPKSQSVWDAAEADDQARAEAMAVSLLHSLTGRVFGLREQTVRPCFGPPPGYSTYAGYSGDGGRAGAVFWPGIALGGVNVVGACGCSSSCSCVGKSEVALPGPVHSIISVMVDGVALTSAAYKVKNRRWLLRTDGREWPQVQNLDVDDDEVGAFTVTYLQGVAVPVAGQVGAGALAVDILKSLTGKGGVCKLPPNVTSVNREGVSMDFDPAAYIEAGLTGVEEADSWIRTVNPGGLRRRPRVLIPGQRGAVKLR